MLIQNYPGGSTNLITYKDITRIYDELKEKKAKETIALRKISNELVAAYEKSLELESATWQAASGVVYEYVATGIYTNNLFENKKISSLHTEDGELNFVINTTVSTLRNGIACGLKMRASLYGDNFRFIVDGESCIVPVEGDEAKFSDLIEIMKEKIITGMRQQMI